MNRVKLGDKSFEELDKLRLSIENNPKNRLPDGSFHLYIPSARKKLEDIAWGITYKLARMEARNEKRM